MLELHQRAAHLPTVPPQSWLTFVRARFLGELRERGRLTTVGLSIHSAVQQSEDEAEVRGVLEYGSGGALPVLYECTGVLNLVTQELTLEDSKTAHYEGRYSQNGRVLSLTRRAADGTRSKPFYLVETATLGQLL